jgi:hypothetical protein
MELTQDRCGDHGLGLGNGKPVLLAAGQVGKPGRVNRVGVLRAPDRPPGRQPQAGPALAGEFRAAGERAG